MRNVNQLSTDLHKRSVIPEMAKVFDENRKRLIAVYSGKAKKAVKVVLVDGKLPPKE